MRARCCAIAPRTRCWAITTWRRSRTSASKFSTSRAREAIAWTQGVLDEPSRAWLNALAVRTSLSGFLAGSRRAGELFRIHSGQARRGGRVRADRRTASFSSATRTSPNIGRATKTATIGHKHMQHGGELVLEDRQAVYRRRRQRRSAARSQPGSLLRRSTIRSSGASSGSATLPIAEVQRKMRARRPSAIIWRDGLEAGRG